MDRHLRIAQASIEKRLKIVTPTQKDLRILYQKSGNRCAFPQCTKSLTFDPDKTGHVTSLSEVAHIVAQSLDGPRGTYPLPLDERDGLDNLILLCEEHHHIIDDNEASYPVEMLRRWKAEHEGLIAQAGKVAKERGLSEIRRDYVVETVYSTLLPVVRLPEYIHSAPCRFGDIAESLLRQRIVYPKSAEAVPFILRKGNIYCFTNLYNADNPFKAIVDDSGRARYSVSDHWDHPDFSRWIIELLNRALASLTRQRGLDFDREHRRYYFAPRVAGETLTVIYTPLNRQSDKRQVVWEPRSKQSGAGKGYWFHLAASLTFLRVSAQQLSLSIRPEIHITRDGIAPYPSEKRGSRITKRASRRHNYAVLGDVQFWRSCLFQDSPRMVVSFGDDQYLVIENSLIQTEVEWPGTPEERARPFRNVFMPETLFSLADLDRLTQSDGDSTSYEDDENSDEWGENESDDNSLWN